MDLMSEMLSSMKCESQTLATFELHGNWGFDVEAVLPGYCYVVVKGECWVLTSGRDAVRLTVGDAVLGPRGGALKIASSPASPLVSMEATWRSHNLPRFEDTVPAEGPVRFEYFASGPRLKAPDQPKPSTQLLAIAFSFAADSRRSIEALPGQIISWAKDMTVAPWLLPAIQFLAAEQSASKHGFVAMSSRLTELILVSLIRAYALTDEAPPTGWLKGLSDARIGRVLEAIHKRPSYNWSVQSLAAVATMSRSGFAARFTQLVGQTPIDYLTVIRVKQARRIVDASSMPVTEIATRVGYRSERAFRSAFKKHVGASPSHRRRTVVSKPAN
jgi:AraC-like DNA-binding protein